VEMIEVVLWKSVAHKWFDLAITMEIIRWLSLVYILDLQYNSIR
jgi:hypothetical protein